MKLLFLIFVSAVIAVSLGEIQNDYCSWEYTFPCRAFANDLTLCGTKGQFGRRCPKDVKMVTLSEEKVLHFINANREKVAIDKPVSKMNALHWCKELALVAERSVKLCDQDELFCPRTFRFKNARIYTRELPHNETQEIDIAYLNKLWRNYKNAYMNDTESFTNEKDAEGYAHFIYYGSTHVGCAALRYTRYSHHKLLFSCVFSSSPKYSDFYADGPPASACSSGIISADYIGLCDVSSKDLKAVSDVC